MCCSAAGVSRHSDSRTESPPPRPSWLGQLRGFSKRLKWVAAKQPVGEGLPASPMLPSSLRSLEHGAQPAAPQVIQIEHVSNGSTVGTVRGGLAMEALVTALGVVMRAILIQVPLELLDSGHANVVEQLPA